MDATAAWALVPSDAMAMPGAPATVEDASADAVPTADAAVAVEDAPPDAPAPVEDAGAEAVASAAPGELAAADCTPAACAAGVASAEALVP
jgi:hypothetical protein